VNVGAFGSVESLRALAEKALNEAVDKALDDTHHSPPRCDVLRRDARSF
jgi:hypothetical protein